MQSDDYTKNMKRKRAGSESEDEKHLDEDKTKKKHKLDKLKRNNNIL